jgi:glycine/D-amino acid oxidase-like deaminating enzyme
VNVGVVGAGIFGLSSALALQRRGHRVTVFDRAMPPAEDAASTDRTKALRFEYGGACPLYVPLVEEARTLWRALEIGASTSLYIETGVLALAETWDESRHEWLSHNYLVEHGWPVELLSPGEGAARFPQFAWDGMAAATFNPQGGYVRAAAAVRATLAAFREAGGVVVAPARVAGLDESAEAARIVVEGGGRFEFDAALVCAGAWFRALVPVRSDFVRPTRQAVTYYRPPSPGAFAAPGFPVWMHNLAGAGWYGMPLDDGVLKVARHRHGEPADPDAPRLVPGLEADASRAFVAHALPAIDPAWYAEDRGCLYALTDDGNFVIDRVPERARTFVAGGGSGHGFKLGPAVGRLAADLVERGVPPVAAFAFDAVRSGFVA